MKCTKNYTVYSQFYAHETFCSATLSLLLLLCFLILKLHTPYYKFDAPHH